MANKTLSGKTTLSIDNAPIRKKNVKPRERLGLLTKPNRKMAAYRMRVDVIEELQELTKKINKKLKIKLGMGTVLELLILDASKRGIYELVDIIRENA